MNFLDVTQNQLSQLKQTLRENEDIIFKLSEDFFNESISFFKKGGKSKIKIKKANKGKFTEYCGGTVTQECINKGKQSPNPKIRKRATFAANIRKWSH